MTRPAFLRGGYTTPTLTTRPTLVERFRTTFGWLVLWALLCVLAWLVMPAAASAPAPVARCSR